MIRWTKVRSARQLSRDLKVKQQVLKFRMKGTRLREHNGAVEGSLWHGLNPISLAHLDPRQNKAGVRTRLLQVKGAFIARMKSGKEVVFKRRGKGRLPIDKQEAPINEQAMQTLENGVFDTREFEAQFYNTFEAELKWRTNSI
jgi:hypothetical protein